jgi:DNA-binding transcriptional ArsR family regulator
VNVHLDRLKELGMIREKRYGNIRMFEIAFDEVNIRFKKHQRIDVKITNFARALFSLVLLAILQYHHA